LSSILPDKNETRRACLGISYGTSDPQPVGYSFWAAREETSAPRTMPRRLSLLE